VCAAVLQICKASAATASQLSKLWKQPAHPKTLQQAPPQTVGSELAGLLQQTTQHVSELARLTSEAWDSAVLLSQQQQEGRHPIYAFLYVLFAATPVPTVTQLLCWLQQRPELLQLQLLAAADDGGAADTGSYSALWASCVTGKLHAKVCVLACSLLSVVPSTPVVLQLQQALLSACAQPAVLAAVSFQQFPASFPSSPKLKTYNTMQHHVSSKLGTSTSSQRHMRLKASACYVLFYRRVGAAAQPRWVLVLHWRPHLHSDGRRSGAVR
jgi:hypothetical protein